VIALPPLVAAAAATIMGLGHKAPETELEAEAVAVKR
jgi:hypothetical protein